MSDALVLAVTGHRPQKLGGFGANVETRLRSFAKSEIERCAPATVITGMALGWDQAIGWSCVELDIPFVAAVPFNRQDSKWNADARKHYRLLLSLASDVVIVSPGGFSVPKMHARNRYMVDRGTCVLALWDGSAGGTANCVGYALMKKKPIDNCWARWTRWPAT